MLVSNLNGVLKAFCSRVEEARSLIIDGKWGIGKTTETLNALKNDIEYSYYSLYGVDSIDTLIIKMSERMDPKFISLFGDKFFISTAFSFDKSEYNGHTLVFDDLERKYSNLEIEQISGLFDSLIKAGFKMVCICNSLIDPQLYDQITEMKEKIFDICCNVEADPLKHNEIIPELSIEFEDSFLKEADDNWRTLKKEPPLYTTNL